MARTSSRLEPAGLSATKRSRPSRLTQFLGKPLTSERLGRGGSLTDHPGNRRAGIMHPARPRNCIRRSYMAWW
jgi:hypothetical protein